MVSADTVGGDLKSNLNENIICFSSQAYTAIVSRICHNTHWKNKSRYTVFSVVRFAQGSVSMQHTELLLLTAHNVLFTGSWELSHVLGPQSSRVMGQPRFWELSSHCPVLVSSLEWLFLPPFLNYPKQPPTTFPGVRRGS